MAYENNPWGGATVPSGKQGSEPRRLGDPSPTLSKRMSEKFERTKEVASIGMEKTKVVASAGMEKSKVAAKKVKEGTSSSVNWVKVKLNKHKLFQKK